MTLDGFLTVSEVAEQTNRTEDAVRKWLQSGRLQGVKVFGWMVPKDALDCFVLPERGRPSLIGSPGTSTDSDMEV